MFNMVSAAYRPTEVSSGSGAPSMWIDRTNIIAHPRPTTRLENGPTAETSTSSRRGLRRFAGLTGTGLAQARKKDDPVKTRMAGRMMGPDRGGRGKRGRG